MAYLNGYSHRATISVDRTQCGSGSVLPYFPGVTDGSSRNASMWPSARFIYHFGGGSSLDLTDSSGNGLDLTDAHANLGYAAGAPGVGGALVVHAAPAGGQAGYAKVANPGLVLPFTISCWAKDLGDTGDPASLGNLKTLWSMNASTGPEGYVATGDGGVFFAFTDNLATIDSTLVPVGTPTAAWNYYAATVEGLAARRYQMNGNAAGTSSAPMPHAMGAIAWLAVGIWLNPTENLFWDTDGVVDELRGWTVARSDDWNVAESNALHNPANFARVSAFAPAPLTAGSGSFTLTGTPAMLRATRQLGASSGAYAWTGTPATLTRPGGSHTLTAGSGAYALTGTAAALRAARVLGARPGAYTWTGHTANLRVQGGAVLPADLVTTVLQLRRTVAMTAALRTTVTMTGER